MRQFSVKISEKWCKNIALPIKDLSNVLKQNKPEIGCKLPRMSEDEDQQRGNFPSGTAKIDTKNIIQPIKNLSNVPNQKIPF